ncbi:MAG: TIR domain-containing protein [Candidatus Dormibacteria bacterium]
MAVSGIFISYRRSDTSGYAGRLADRLSARFGVQQIFRDIDTLKPGVDFVAAVDDAVKSCDALIVLMGKDWLNARDAQGNRRLDNPNDFPRLEISAALSRDILVLPVLVEGAVMPSPEELPEPLQKLSRINALDLSDARWDYDVQRLIKGLESAVTSTPAAAESHSGPAMAVQLEPRTVTGRLSATGELTVANRGADHMRVSVTARAPGGRLDFTILPPRLLVNPGGSAVSRITVRAGSPVVLGAAVEHTYEVSATPDGGESVTVDGILYQQPVLPEDLAEHLEQVNRAAGARLAPLAPVAQRAQVRTRATVDAVRPLVGPILAQVWRLVNRLPLPGPRPQVQVAFTVALPVAALLLVLAVVPKPKPGTGPVVLPNLSGMNIDQAAAVLQIDGLTVSQVYEVFGGVARRQVLTTDPPAGTTVKHAGVVVLHLAQGRIAFTRVQPDNSEMVYVMNPDGTGQRPVGAQSAAIASYPAWSHDGARIAFTSSATDPNVGNLAITDVNGGHRQQLTRGNFQDLGASWSPDDRSIVFSSNRSGHPEIWAINTDGSNLRQLTHTSAANFEPAWSPDGRRIAFVSTRDGNAEVYSMSSDGTHQVNLTRNPASDEFPAWSPDGDLIAFDSNRGGGPHEVCVMHADGSDAQQLTSDDSENTSPAWSPDQTRILFTSNRDGHSVVYTMDPAGQDTRSLSDSGAGDFSPSW